VELLADPEMYRWMHVHFVQPSEDGYRAILERAHQRGELAEEIDPRLLTRVVSGATTSLAQTGRLSREQTTETLLRLLLGGLLQVTE
jgi:hypothetical protein